MPSALFMPSFKRICRGVCQKLFLQVGFKVPVTSTCGEIFSQNKRRLKMSFIGTVGTTVVVIQAKFRENLPRGLSEKCPPSWLQRTHYCNLRCYFFPNQETSQDEICGNISYYGWGHTCQVARGSADVFVSYLSAEFAIGYQ